MSIEKAIERTLEELTEAATRRLEAVEQLRAIAVEFPDLIESLFELISRPVKEGSASTMTQKESIENFLILNGPSTRAEIAKFVDEKALRNFLKHPHFKRDDNGRWFIGKV
ncbi:MAG: hypothetical protein AAFV88_14120 [Planctomycetota bacterium]